MNCPKYVNFSADVKIIDRWKDQEGIAHVRLTNGLVGEQDEDGIVIARIKTLETASKKTKQVLQTADQKGRVFD